MKPHTFAVLRRGIECAMIASVPQVLGAASFRPWLGGFTMAGLIYLITFPSWDGAVVTGSEDPRRRPTVSLTSPTPER